MSAEKVILEEAAGAFRRGEISFDTFARRTRPYWMTQATKVLRRWSHPSDVGPEDLVQVMLLEAWQRSESFDVGRIPPGNETKAFRRYLVWNAVDKAKKWLHRARGAAGARGNAPSRYARAFTSFAVDGLEDTLPAYLERAMSHDPTAELEHGLDLAPRIDGAIARAPDEATASALAALKLSGFDPERASEKLYQDRYCRLEFKLPNRQAARRLLDRAALAVAL